MLQPRIIELENYRRRGETYVCVSKRSTTEPPLMRACSESRRECRRVYQQRRFDNLPDSLKLKRDGNVWWNPELDIIYLGTNTCPSTALQICQMSHDHGAIPQIALIVDETSCHWSCRDCQLGGSPDQPPGFCPYGFIGKLHGFESASGSDRFSGCAGLKELFFVVPSRLWASSVGLYTSFRRATSNGVEYNQMQAKGQLLKSLGMLKLVPRFSDIGENRWVGDRMPTHRFVSFAPVSYGKTRFDAITITKHAFEKLRRANMGEVERRTGCRITLPDYDEARGVHSCIQEVGLCGSRESSSKAKNEIAGCIFNPQRSGWRALLPKLIWQSEYACRPCENCCSCDPAGSCLS